MESHIFKGLGFPLHLTFDTLSFGSQSGNKIFNSIRNGAWNFLVRKRVTGLRLKNGKEILRGFGAKFF